MTSERSLETFRLHLMLTATLLVLTFAGVAAVLTFVPLFAYLDDVDLASVAAAEISAYFIHLHESFWPVVAGAIIASTASGLVLFQRMRSPLTRFAAVYRVLAQGGVPAPLRIRATDYLQSESNELNHLIEAIRQRDMEERHQLERAREALSELEATERAPKDLAALAEIREALDRLGGQRSDSSGSSA